MEFEVTTSEPFFVSLTWPGHRMVQPCKELRPDITLAVARADTISEPQLGSIPTFRYNSAEAKVTRGRGIYVVYVSVEFPHGDFVSEVVLTVYAKQAVLLERSARSHGDTGLAMFGASQGGRQCNQVTIPGQGLFTKRTDKTYRGVPTYRSIDDGFFAYYVARKRKWEISSMEKWQQVMDGEFWASASVTKAEMQCGCHDSPDHECVTADCGGPVKRFCPVACGLSQHCHTGTFLPPPSPSLVIMLSER